MSAPYLSVQQAACRLGVSERHVRLLCARGTLEGAWRAGVRTWLIPQTTVEQYTPAGKGWRKGKRSMWYAHWYAQGYGVPQEPVVMVFASRAERDEHVALSSHCSERIASSDPTVRRAWAEGREGGYCPFCRGQNGRCAACGGTNHIA